MEKKIDKAWYIYDFEDIALGRGASKIAQVLIGKHKPSYQSHQDAGDYVIVINANKFELTGNKELSKRYYKHTGYLGNIKEKDLDDITRVDAVYRAVRGMLPKNKLLAGRLERLKIYEGTEHKHQNIKEIKELK